MSNTETETPEPPAPQFRKTKQGKWAVMGPVETLQTALDGDGKVKVLKKNGDWSSFNVVSMGRPFDVEGVDMAYGYSDEGDAEAGSNSSGTSNSGSRPRPSGADSQQGSSAPATPPSPGRDESEPMPEYQGGADDEWQDSF